MAPWRQLEIKKALQSGLLRLVLRVSGGLGVPQPTLRLQGLGRSAHLLALYGQQVRHAVLGLLSLSALAQASAEHCCLASALAGPRRCTVVLVSVPGFVADMICMHAIDLGVSQEILGSILFQCLGVFALGENRAARVADLFVKLKQHYERMRTPNRLSALTVEMLKREGKAPKLRAKGSETRHLVPFGVEVAAAMHAFLKDDHSLTAWKCLSALLDLMMCFGAKPFFVDAVKRATQACCMLFAALSQEAQRLGKQTWRIKPKLHMLQELGEFQVDEMGDPSLF